MPAVEPGIYFVRAVPRRMVFRVHVFAQIVDCRRHSGDRLQEQEDQIRGRRVRGRKRRDAGELCQALGILALHFSTVAEIVGTLQEKRAQKGAFQRTENSPYSPETERVNECFDQLTKTAISDLQAGGPRFEPATFVGLVLLRESPTMKTNGFTALSLFRAVPRRADHTSAVWIPEFTERRRYARNSLEEEKDQIRRWRVRCSRRKLGT